MTSNAAVHFRTDCYQPYPTLSIFWWSTLQLSYLIFFAQENYWQQHKLGNWWCLLVKFYCYYLTTFYWYLMLYLALGGQAAFFMGAAYCNCHQKYLAVAFVALAQGLSGFQYGGVIVNHVDIAPRYAGTLYGISNTFATAPGFVAPIIVAALTSEVMRSSSSLLRF